MLPLLALAASVLVLAVGAFLTMRDHSSPSGIECGSVYQRSESGSDSYTGRPTGCDATIADARRVALPVLGAGVVLVLVTGSAVLVRGGRERLT